MWKKTKEIITAYDVDGNETPFFNGIEFATKASKLIVVIEYSPIGDDKSLKPKDLVGLLPKN